ncbi:MAG: aminoacyl-tRNA hydrolase [Myxococcales bacterium]|nr:MAG: aminoacyl-tRNA hydrolase [Myxococcales bacterium]
MKLIVGLGNPGSKYATHRHNIGFMVLATLLSRLGAGPLKDKFKGLFAKGSFKGQDFVLLAPQTFMNLSGESVQQAQTFFKVEPADVLIVHDELDLPFGSLRLKKGGGTAGHNGLRSIVNHGGHDFGRLRFGIGRPPGIKVENYVLSSFSSEERAELPELLEKAAEMSESFLSDGLDFSMNRHNSRNS